MGNSLAFLAAEIYRSSQEMGWNAQNMIIAINFSHHSSLAYFFQCSSHILKIEQSPITFLLLLFISFLKKLWFMKISLLAGCFNCFILDRWSGFGFGFRFGFFIQSIVQIFLLKKQTESGRKASGPFVLPTKGWGRKIAKDGLRVTSKIKTKYQAFVHSNKK